MFSFKMSAGNQKHCQICRYLGRLALKTIMPLILSSALFFAWHMFTAVPRNHIPRMGPVINMRARPIFGDRTMPTSTLQPDVTAIMRNVHQPFGENMVEMAQSGTEDDMPEYDTKEEKASEGISHEKMADDKDGDRHDTEQEGEEGLYDNDGGGSNRKSGMSLYSEIPGNKGKLIAWYLIPSYRKPTHWARPSCGKHVCFVTHNTSMMAQADAVIIDAFLLSRYRDQTIPVRTSPNQAWIFFTKEPWGNYNTLFPAPWKSIFNWTHTYRRDSDFIVSYGELALKTNTIKEDWRAILKKKTKSVLWFVSHCDSHGKRETYVNELKKYIDVDIVGRCGRKQCIKGVQNEGENECFQQHRFYLSFESIFCKDYVTEKFFKTFSHHIVPIVRGAINYSDMYPRDTFINTADFASPKKLGKYLKYLEKNTTAYLHYLKTHAQYRVWGRGTSTCELCEHLYNLDEHRKSFPDITEWMGECDLPKNPLLQ